jgi:choice-of-anchor A domain-containing protein
MTGSLAAGGGITLANYAVASQVTGVPSAALNPANIVVGGTLIANNGNLGNGQGSVYFENGAPQISNFTISGNAVNSTPFDFSTSQTYYQSAATALGALTANGTTQICDGCINFTGKSNTLNVFTVRGSDLANANEINITVPAGSAVVINVTGNNAKFQNGAVQENGVTAANVLWNFANPTNITLVGSMDPMGTILAPFSTVIGGYGAMTGQLVAANFTGNTSFTDVQYACTLPVP